jgi:membrane protease YdiL (CAAX protease family)
MLAPGLTLLNNQFMLATLSITFSVIIARKWVDRRSVVSLGLNLNQRSLKDIFVGFIIAGIMIGLVFVVEWAMGWLVIEANSWQINPPLVILKDLAYWFVMFVFVGWHEELLSRGYHLSNLTDGINLPWAIILSSALFSLGHFNNPSSSIGSILGIFAAGITFAFSYIRSGNLWLPIGLHIGWNFFEGPVFGFPVSGIKTSFLISHNVQGPVWLTGGDFGPEAGLILLPALTLGVYIIYMYTKYHRV